MVPSSGKNLGQSSETKGQIHEFKNNKTGADPERNLTRSQRKARGCDYMGVALSMASCKHDLVDAAQLST